jgi:hypothetical protein
VFGWTGPESFHPAVHRLAIPNPWSRPAAAAEIRWRVFAAGGNSAGRAGGRGVSGKSGAHMAELAMSASPHPEFPILIGANGYELIFTTPPRLLT